MDFHFFGINYFSGGASTLVYDSRFLANRTEVVVVIISYRLGPLGWLVTPKNLRGNLGLMDQRMAFTWVRNNIDAFGGDSRKVTYFGEASLLYFFISPAK